MKTLAAALAAVLLLILTACGGGATGTAFPVTGQVPAPPSLLDSATATPDPVSVSSSTREASSTAPTPQIPEVSTASTGDGERALVELADRMRAGIAVTSSARGSIDVYVGATGEVIPMMSYQQQTSPDGTVVALAGDITGEDAASQSFRWIDGRLFMGGETARLFDATWLEITSESHTPGLQAAHAAFEDAMVSTSMAQYVEYLGVAHEMIHGGPIQIGGDDLDWYVFVLDLTELDDTVMTDSARDALVELRNQGLTRVGCEYRLDDEGRLRYVQLDLDDSAEPTSIISTYTDINVPSDIAVPDPSETVVAP